MIKEVKKVEVATNYNKKYMCDHFIHIERMVGVGPINHELLTSKIIEWHFMDGSSEPIKSECYDLHRMPAKYLMDWQSRLSHGMCRQELKKLLQVEDGDQIGIFSYVTIKK